VIAARTSAGGRLVMVTKARFFSGGPAVGLAAADHQPETGRAGQIRSNRAGVLNFSWFFCGFLRAGHLSVKLYLNAAAA